VLSARDLVFRYAVRSQPALDSVSIEVNDGETVAVVGPSGAGKTTLLRLIAGLLPTTCGDVCLDGVSLLQRAPQERRIALVAQDDALFANMTVRENLRFAMRGGATVKRGFARLRQARTWKSISTESRGICPAASVSGSQSRVRCSPTRWRCCSMSRLRISILRCAAAFVTKYCACAGVSGVLFFMLRTTTSRR
jgi:ABC-type sugar transport system ATPase subunit